MDSITVYADYVCPFCYLGRSSLETFRTRREEPLDVSWQPFDLRANKRGADDEILDGVDDAKGEEYYNQAKRNVQRLQQQYDVEMAQDLATNVDSWTAGVASLFVRERHPDDWEAFDNALYRALWVDGRDIGSRDVVTGVAADVGLDSDAVETALSESTWEDNYRNSITDSRENGISGVPTFVYDDRTARGAVPPEQLSRLVDGVNAQ
jgi:Predicted dithiol-disulfide isomerase involved in polyketide biosynthesis